MRGAKKKVKKAVARGSAKPGMGRNMSKSDMQKLRNKRKKR